MFEFKARWFQVHFANHRVHRDQTRGPCHVLLLLGRRHGLLFLDLSVFRSFRYVRFRFTCIFSRRFPCAIDADYGLHLRSGVRCGTLSDLHLRILSGHWALIYINICYCKGDSFLLLNLKLVRVFFCIKYFGLKWSAKLCSFGDPRWIQKLRI